MDNFSSGTLNTALWNPLQIAGGFTPVVVDVNGEKRIRMTTNAGNQSTMLQLKKWFPGAGNKITVEFDYYVYGGNGADGVTVVFSDAGTAPAPGGFGGSLGYAQRNDPNKNGFSGGWLAVGIDEYGNFPNPSEGRTGYPAGWSSSASAGAYVSAGAYQNNISVRGSGSGVTGYPLLANTGTLSPPIWQGSNTSSTKQRFRITIDHTDNIHAYVTVERDTTPNGNNYHNVVNKFDVKAASGQAAVPANWLVSFTGGTGGSNNFHEISQLNICAPFVNDPGGSSNAGSFECLEAGTNSPWDATARKPLYTKLVSTNFTFDIAALKTDGTLESNYVAAGGNAKYAKVELFDDTAPAASCSAYANPKASQTVTFASGTFSGAPGRALTGNFNLGSAYNKLRCRVRECSDSTCTSFTAMAAACSSDKFAIRPPSFAAAITKADNSALSNPIRAGQDDIKATVSMPTAGYVGSAGFYPTLSVDHNGASVNGRGTLTKADVGNTVMVDPASPASTGEVSFAVSAATAGSGNFRYHDAGTLILAIRDKTYTSIDQSAGDCIVGSASNTLIGGKYGCDIGLDKSISRFIPDHFTVSGSFTPSCSGGGFTYMEDSRLGLNFTVSAKSKAEVTATQYANPCPTVGSCKLTLTAQNGSTPIDISRLMPLASFPAGTSASYQSTTWSNGVYAVSGSAFKYTRGATPDGAYDNFKLKAAIADPDDVAVTGVDTSSETRVRYGRIALSNAHGSERLPLPIPMKMQYYQAGTGWIINADDSCTPITLPASIGINYAALSAKNNLSAAGNSVKAYLKNASGVVTGNQLSLASPASSAVGPGSGYVDLYFDLAAMPWLNFNWKGKSVPTAAELNPTARATFGVFKNANEFIYMREMY